MFHLMILMQEKMLKKFYNKKLKHNKELKLQKDKLKLI